MICAMAKKQKKMQLSPLAAKDVDNQADTWKVDKSRLVTAAIALFIACPKEVCRIAVNSVTTYEANPEATLRDIRQALASVAEMDWAVEALEDGQGDDKAKTRQSRSKRA